MLAIPLPQFKRQLEEMLLDLQHLVTAMQQLRDLLPEHSEKRVTVLTLMGRLNDANKKALRGTLDNTALQTEYNAIRADLSDFIQALEDVDFDANAKQENTSAKASAVKQGSVLYRIPHTMPIGQETECVVRIALDEDAIVEEITIDSQTVLKGLSRVSDLMQVELADPAREPVFSIRSTSSAQQLITEEGYTQWFFYVEPLRVGTHPLEVKVSVLELAFNQVHRKELVFRETIQIITENNATQEEADESIPPSQPPSPAFKNAGQAFAFGDAPVGLMQESESPIHKGAENLPSEPPTPNESYSSGGNKGLRTLALFLAFILLGSTATWAFTPEETRDWWVASLLEDDREAYTAFLEKHPDSQYREKALFYRAERSEQLADLQEYQQEYGATGKYREKVAVRMAALETRAIDNIRQNPRRDNIRQFAADFPESNRLSEVKQAAEARADNRAELLAEVESAYINAARLHPTEQHIKNYLGDFQEHKKLADLADVVAASPSLRAKVQPDFEAAISRKVQAATNADEVREMLPVLEKMGSSNAAQKVEKMVAQNPQLKKQVKLQQQVRASSEVVRQREKAEAAPMPDSPDAEQQDWDATLQANTAKAFIEFQYQHPKSAHITEARAKIKTFNLTLKERKRLELEAARKIRQETAQ